MTDAIIGATASASASKSRELSAAKRAPRLLTLDSDLIRVASVIGIAVDDGSAVS